MQQPEKKKRTPNTLPFNASYPFFWEENPVSERIPDSSFVLPFQDMLSITHFPKPVCSERVTRHTPVVWFFFSFLKISGFMCDLQCLTDDYSAHHLQKNSHSHFLYTPPHRNKSVSWLMETLSCQSLCFVPSLLPPAWESCRDAGKWLNCNTEPWEQ